MTIESPQQLTSNDAPVSLADAQCSRTDLASSAMTMEPSQQLASNVPASLTDAQSLGLVHQDLPKSFQDVWNYCPDPQYPTRRTDKVVAFYAMQLKRPGGVLSTQQRQVVFNILKSLYEADFPDSNPDVPHFTHIKNILLCLMGESRIATAPFAFPDPFPANAAFLLERIEALLGLEAESSVQPSPTSPPSPTIKGKKRKRNSTITSPVEVGVPDLQDRELQPVMRNLKYSAARRIVIDDKESCRSYNAFGHNGLDVGDWWPVRMCVMRDGGHGSIQGGIAGNSEGARSIMVGGSYEGLDRDEGDVIYYCGSNSHLNKDKENAHLTNATKNMQQTRRINKPIRVFRNHKGTSNYAPSAGIRYDGLYKIQREVLKTNDVGGLYLQFVLQRLEGQPPIDQNRPNVAERRISQRLKESV